MLPTTWENNIIKYQRLTIALCEELGYHGRVSTCGPIYGSAHYNLDLCQKGYWFRVEIEEPNIQFIIGYHQNLVLISEVHLKRELFTNLNHPLSINRLKSFILGSLEKPVEQMSMSITHKHEEPRAKIVAYSKNAPYYKGEGYLLWEVPTDNGFKYFKEPMTDFMRDHLK